MPLQEWLMWIVRYLGEKERSFALLGYKVHLKTFEIVNESFGNVVVV